MAHRNPPTHAPERDDDSRWRDDAAAEDLDTRDINDTSDSAERLATYDEIDEETSEELGVDNIVGAADAGLGGGLDQQEEALAGITDEEIARHAGRKPPKRK